MTSALFILYVLGAITAFVAFSLIEGPVANTLVQPKRLGPRRTWPLLATTILSLAGVYSFTTFSVVLLAEDARTGSACTALSRGCCSSCRRPSSARSSLHWSGGLRTVRLGVDPPCRHVRGVAILIALTCSPSMSGQCYTHRTYRYRVERDGLHHAERTVLSVLLAPKDAPAVLSGLNGASFGISGLGIALVAPFVALGTHAGYTTSLLISIGVAALAAIATLLLRRPETSSPASEGTPAGATV